MTLPSSPAIVGSAVARIVWSSTAGSIAATIAAKPRVDRPGVGAIGETLLIVGGSHILIFPYL